MAKENTVTENKGVGVLLIVLILLLLGTGGTLVWALDHFDVYPLYSVPVVGRFVAIVDDPFAQEKEALQALKDQLADQAVQLEHRLDALVRQEVDLNLREAALQQEGLMLHQQQADLLQLQHLDIRLKQLANMYASMMSSQAAASLRHLENATLIEILSRMPVSSAADIVGRLPEQKAASLAKAMGSDSVHTRDPEIEQLIAMAEMYSKMEPRVAAESIRVLEPTFAAQLLAEMTPDTATHILAAIPPHQASLLIGVMAGRGSTELSAEKERQLRNLAQLYSGLDTAQGAASLETMDEQTAVNIIEYMVPNDVQRFFEQMSTFKVARLVAIMANEELDPIDSYDSHHYNVSYVASLVSKMSHSEAADVLEGMDKEMITEILKVLPPDMASGLLSAIPQTQATQVVLYMSGAKSQLGQLLQEQNFNQLLEIYTTMEPKQASLLIQQISDDQTIMRILSNIAAGQASSIMSEMPQTMAIRLTRLMANTQTVGDQDGGHVVGRIFSNMRPQEAADLIITSFTNNSEVAQILKTMPEVIAADVISAIKERNERRAADIVKLIGL